MRVKIGNQWHDSNEEPVAIQVSPGEQEQIGSMDRTKAPNGCYAVFPESWDGYRKAMRRWISGEGAESAMDNRMRPPLRTPPPPSTLAHVYGRIVQALELTADELEAPALKDRGDVEHARQMDRRMLEEKYALARMTARLASLHLKRAQAEEPDAIREQLGIRIAELEDELEHTQVQRDALAEKLERAEEVKVRLRNLEAQLQGEVNELEDELHQVKTEQVESEQHVAQPDGNTHETEQHSAHSTGVAP